MRPQNWPSLLDEYVRAAKAKQFAWGSHDCLTFATDWHRAITGLDAFAPWRGAYDSETGARRLIVEAGAQSMADAGQILFGAPNAVLRMAKRGDIVLVRKSFGIVTGRVGAFVGEDGLVLLPAIEFEQAWTV